MSIADLVNTWEAERIQARRREDIAFVRTLDPAWYDPLGPEPCSHPKDALGTCIGPCAGEEWDR